MSDAIEVFYDGACPLCAREIELLRRLDRAGVIGFTDIAAPDFDERAAGLPFSTLMGRIHGRLPDGTFVEGVEVFRRLYDAVGFGSLVRLSRLAGIRHALDAGYDWFARHRLRITGRCEADTCTRPIRAS